MKAHGLVDRMECPLCGACDPARLFAVSPSVFLGANPTIDEMKLQSSGLLSLPDIEIVECCKCRFRFCGQTLSDDWTSVFWGDVYIPQESQLKILKASKRRSNIAIWSKLSQFLFSGPIADGETLNVLDFGSGWGDFLLTAKAPGVRMVGIEISPPKVEFAKQHGIEVYASIDEIPSDLQFHAFHCDQVFEHVIDPALVLRQIESVLHPSFVGYVGVPNYSDDRVHSLARKINTDAEVKDKDLITWDHVNYFSPQTFSRFLAACEFVPIELPGGNSARGLKETSAFIRRKAAVRKDSLDHTTPKKAGVSRMVTRLSEKLLRSGSISN